MKYEILKNARLSEYQEYITNVLTERGFITQDVNTRFILLAEETGELARALRRYNKEKVDQNSQMTNLEEELVDVFFVLLSIANKCDINLSEAFVKKEEKNNKRTWT